MIHMKSKIHSLKKLELFKELDTFREGKFFAIADQKVKNHLPQWIQFSPYVFWLKNPEADKNLENYEDALKFFIKQGINPRSHLYAFGGGATLDFTGYIATTFMGGIGWSAIPTTISGMVDGAMCGVVSLNMTHGKNFIGTVSTPQTVFLCHEFLTTLSELEWLCGKGEILKCGLLSKDINELVLKDASMEQIVFECARFRNDSHGDKVHAAFGKNVGLAMELTMKVPQGQAVIMGLKLLHRVLKLDEPISQINKMLAPLHLPFTKFDVESYPSFDVKNFLHHLEHDKYTQHAHHSFVLARRAGSLYPEEISFKDFASRLLGSSEWKKAA